MTINRDLIKSAGMISGLVMITYALFLLYNYLNFGVYLSVFIFLGLFVGGMLIFLFSLISMLEPVLPKPPIYHKIYKGVQSEEADWSKKK